MIVSVALNIRTGFQWTCIWVSARTLWCPPRAGSFFSISSSGVFARDLSTLAVQARNFTGALA